MSLKAFVIIDMSSDSLSIYDSSIEAKIYFSSSVLLFFRTKFPSSNYSKVIMSPVYSWYDVAYGIYETSGHIASASEYGIDVYDNSLENISSNTISCEETIFRALGT